MQYARSLLFSLVFYPATFLLSLIGAGASLVGSQATTRAVVIVWASLHQWLARHLLGIRVRVEGKIPAGPSLIAVKHQAMFETVHMMLIAGTPVVVMKRELTDMAVFGWMARSYGAIPVERDAGAKALRRMLTLGREAVSSGRSILIYPEGTRVAVGEKPPLQAGFAGLYRALNLPVVPVAMDSGRVWSRGLLKHSGTVTFHIGEPIPAGLPRAEIEARVHAGINRLEA